MTCAGWKQTNFLSQWQDTSAYLTGIEKDFASIEETAKHFFARNEVRVMKDETHRRMAGDYEIIRAIHIGDREIVLGEKSRMKALKIYVCLLSAE
ncbi:MAG: hypothetical protein ACLTLQ_10860 [[Clostridium] scindens]